MSRKELGKIKDVTFGYVGYQDCQFGISFIFSLNGGGTVANSRGAWNIEMKPSKSSKWSEEDRQELFGDVMTYINQLRCK